MENKLIKFEKGKLYYTPTGFFTSNESYYTKGDLSLTTYLPRRTILRYCGKYTGKNCDYLKFVVESKGKYSTNIVCVTDHHMYYEGRLLQLYEPNNENAVEPVVCQKYKCGDKVVLAKTNANNKVGAKFTFKAYLPQQVGLLDCIVLTEEGKATFGISANLKPDKEAELRKEIGIREAIDYINSHNVFISIYQEGLKTVAILPEEETAKIYKAEARCNPKDKFDPLFGAMLAVARVMNDKEMEGAILGDGNKD